MSELGAVVVGGEGHVGRAVCDKLRSEGFEVVIIDSTQPEDRSPSTLVSSLQSLDEAASVMSAVRNQLGGVDALVLAQGVLTARDGGVSQVAEQAFAESFETNLVVSWRTVRQCLPLMSRGGSIVVVGSLVAHRGSASAQLAYTASKGALAAFARELAIELAPRGIRVNVVAPGPLDGGGLFPASEDDHAEAIRLSQVPLGRRGHASEVAHAVAFLAGPASAYMTGATLMVDGGASAAFIPSLRAE